MTISASAQVQPEDVENISKLEDWYIKLGPTFKFTIAGQTIKINDAEKYEDLFINNALQHSLHVDNKIDYDFKHFSSAYKNALIMIENFTPSEEDSSLTSINKIVNAINHLEAFKEKAFAFTLLSYNFLHFDKVLSTKYIDRINKTLNISTKNLDDQYTYIIASADYAKTQDLPTSLTALESAYDYFDEQNNITEIAEIEQNISSLYALRGNYEYQTKSIKHLVSANRNYLKLSDTINRIHNFIAIALSTLDFFDSSYIANPEELISRDNTILMGGIANGIKHNENETNKYFVEKINSSKYQIFSCVHLIDFQKNDYTGFTGWKYLILGDYFLKINKLELASDYYYLSLFQGKNIIQTYTSLERLSKLYTKTKNYEKSIKHIDAAITMACKCKQTDILCISRLN